METTDFRKDSSPRCGFIAAVESDHFLKQRSDSGLPCLAHGWCHLDMTLVYTEERNSLVKLLFFVGQWGLRAVPAAQQE